MNEKTVQYILKRVPPTHLLNKELCGNGKTFTSEDLIFTVGDKKYFGHYHCNGFFYAQKNETCMTLMGASSEHKQNEYELEQTEYYCLFKDL